MLHNLKIATSNEFTGIEHSQITFSLKGEVVDRIVAKLNAEELFDHLRATLKADIDSCLSWTDTGESAIEFSTLQCGTYIEHWQDELTFSILVPNGEDPDRKLDGTAEELSLSDTFWIEPSRIIRAFLAA